jgi:ELWxxDGT repeat protein
MKINILAILFSCCAYMATAQVTVYDINKTAPGMQSIPHFLTPFEGKLYFMATDGIHGYELWGIDSSIGEFMVADINPGPGDALPGFYTNGYAWFNYDFAVTYAEVVGKDALFFIADDGVHGCELYLYDGVNPPMMVKEFIPGPQGIKNVQFLAAIDNYVFICEPKRGIWQYNLNTGNYVLLPGTDGANTPTELAVVNGVLCANLFRAQHSGYVLWKYNPVTRDSTVVATQLQTSPRFASINNRLYYVGGMTDHHMYEYDGVATPKKISPTSTGNEWQVFGWFNNKVYFLDSGSNLSEYDPVSKAVKIALNNTFPKFRPRGGFVQYKDKMYMAAIDTTHGLELWEWDGINSPRLAADIYSGIASNSSYKHDFVSMPDGVYFVANNSEQSAGIEVHRYKPFPATVHNLSFKGKVRAYPNPVTSTATLALQLHTAQTLYVELYNTEGRKVLAIQPVLYSSGTSRVELSMRNLPAGNYFYHVRNKDNATVVSGKLVKL